MEAERVVPDPPPEPAKEERSVRLRRKPVVILRDLPGPTNPPPPAAARFCAELDWEREPPEEEACMASMSLGWEEPPPPIPRSKGEVGEALGGGSAGKASPPLAPAPIIIPPRLKFPKASRRAPEGVRFMTNGESGVWPPVPPKRLAC